MLEQQIFHIKSNKDFENIALEVFQYQFRQVSAYRTYCELLHIRPDTVKAVRDIPFLPIELFKKLTVISSEKKPETTFTSSGTTGSITSKHVVADLGLYRTSFLHGFKHFYGDPNELVILALLPSYLEREGSSLVYMVDQLIKETNNPHSGFYLNELDTLAEKLTALDHAGKKVLLLGVSYALLDLIEQRTFQLKNTYVMETGGMKGQRQEMIKEALHARLKTGFGVQKIHSEYGMTELLSQAYSKGDGLFSCPPWMRILTRDPEDPFALVNGRTGGINVIDLANLNSCSFIATQDLGKTYADESFEILGRFDTSDIRGCNLMVL
ncbi:MAG: acyl transferase [Bacteroidota bacterium]